MKEKICFIFNCAPHYRENIYKRIDNSFDCDFYFGDFKTVKLMNVRVLKHFKAFLRNVVFSPKLYWQRGVLSLAFKPYKKYLMSADVTCFTNYLLWLLIKIQPNKRLVFWGHGATGKEGKLRFLLSIYMLWCCDKFMTYGNYARNILINKGIDENKLITIYNSLDYDKQLGVRQGLVVSNIYKNHFGNDNLNLIFIGRLTPQKKLSQVLEAINLLKSRGTNVNMTFIGTGDMQQDLELIVQKYDISSNVNFYGACYDEAIIADHLYNADLCVSPGNIGLTAMHSLMYGCPAITHSDFKWQMPEFEAITEGVTGSFFEKDSVQSLASKIENWMEYAKNNREQIRRECFKEIDSRWNPQNQIEIIKDVLNNI